MDILTKYMDLQEEIFDYFGFKQDWVILPIDDRRDFYWHIDGNEKNGFVKFAEERMHIDEDTGDYYEDEIYSQRFYNKWVYRGIDYTMIMVDTHVDGNRFLAIFSNEKEI